VTDSRLDWLRNGLVDGKSSDNKATLMLTRDGYLPRADAQGNSATAPPMDLMGALVGTPARAAVAGDVRANENIALTGIQTLFAREHNRLVAALPRSLSEEAKFQVARRVLGAEEQYITYNEFLPAMGVRLRDYRGYDPGVNAGLSNEFAVVGYRAHSMIHGEFDVTQPVGTYTDAQLATFAAEGITVSQASGQVSLTIPLNLAFGNPDLLQAVGIGPVLQALGAEREYKNDEQIDNSLRSVLFQVPKPGIPDPSVCGDPVVNPDRFTGVSDLGAIDIERGRDHGMPSYNQLRRALGLRPARSFTDITGEETERFPQGIRSRDPISDPHILDFVKLLDDNGNVIPFGTQAAQDDAVVGIRRTTLAARLKAIYGSVDGLDAFVGMVSEQHVAGTEFGELQLALWKQQFTALRDGDRLFYLNDPALREIERAYGLTYRHTLAELIALDTGATVQADVFHATG
jgi:Animal haem peroxidase